MGLTVALCILGVRQGRVVEAAAVDALEQQRLVRPGPPGRVGHPVHHVVAQGLAVDGHVVAQEGVEEDLVGRAALEDGHRGPDVGTPGVVAGVEGPFRSVQGIGQRDLGQLAVLDQEAGVATVGVQRLAFHQRAGREPDLVPREHQGRIGAAGALDGPDHPATGRPDGDTRSDRGPPEVAGHSVDLHVEVQDPIAVRIGHDRSSPERILRPTRRLVAVVGVVQLVEMGFGLGPRQELGGRPRPIQVVRWQDDAVRGVQIPGPRHRVVRPVVVVVAGDREDGVSERPDRGSLEQGALRAVPALDHRVLLHRGQLGGRQHGRERRDLGPVRRRRR